MVLMRPDPNKDRNDPMSPDYWELGEDLQNSIRVSGYEPEGVEGIAVDVHDLLQAAEAIRAALEVGLSSAKGDSAELIGLLDTLAFEFDHIAWHCGSAVAYLTEARAALDASTP
jgi:hypothetical protein